MSLNNPYPRPALVCIKDGKEYTLSKRCERIFYPRPNVVPLPINEKLRQQYRSVIEDYRRNSKNTAKAFRTWLPHDELQEGELVYFKKSAGKVDSIIPVCISRQTDPKPLGMRLPHENLRPCSRTCLEECDVCTGKNCNIPLYREGFPLNGLCPACHLFGVLGYRGRVRFGFALRTGEGEAKWLEREKGDKGITLPLLEQPRPTWVLKSGAENIPGRKFYVHHNGWQTVAAGKDPITLKHRFSRQG